MWIHVLTYQIILMYCNYICICLYVLLQVSVLEMMTRYVRNQFVDPAPGSAAQARLESKQRSVSATKSHLASASSIVTRRVVKKAFYSDEEDESDEEVFLQEEVSSRVDSSLTKTESNNALFSANDVDLGSNLDPDHRLVLRSCLPLLKSRNSGVVLNVAALHFYCGGRGSTADTQIGKALVRIMRNQREIQFVILTSIASMARERPNMFLPYLSDFFVKPSDPIFCRYDIWTTKIIDIYVYIFDICIAVKSSWP